MQRNAFAKVCKLVLLCFALGLASGPARALNISISMSITNTLAPDDPIFPDGRLSGSVQFTEVVAGDPVVFVPIGGPILVPPLAPAETFPPVPIYPPDPVSPGNPILVSFTGTLGSDLGDFPAYFYPPVPVLPSDPPATAPMINLGAFTAGVSALHLSGPVIAFDDPYQVGTWEITVAAVPEPASLTLLALGLAGLGLGGRRRG